MADAVSSTPPDAPKHRVRGERRVRAVAASTAYVTRAIPFYDFLDEEQLVRIEDQAD